MIYKIYYLNYKLCCYAHSVKINYNYNYNPVRTLPQ
jgi:hypothetical protein